MDNRSRFFSACRVILAVLFCGCIAVSGYCAEVGRETARGVAESQVKHHLAVFGHWNGSRNPTVADVQPVHIDSESTPIAYHCRVHPGGYILVTPDDVFSPIPFYSTRATFDPARAGQAIALESWIVPEMTAKMGALRRYRSRSAADARYTAAAWTGSDRIRASWRYLKSWPHRSSGATRLADAEADGQVTARGAVAPMLTTAWGQSAPYNNKMPDDGCLSGHTVTGCVATAWAQVLKYHEWPDQGTGTGDYSWDGSAYVDFSDARAYDWGNMPDLLTESSTQAQKDAVGWLMYFTAMAAETDFGCLQSSSAAWASDVFDRYFKYKASISFRSRYTEDDALNPVSVNYDAEQWFDLIKSELDQGRLVIFSIFSDNTGHEVVVDGYDETMDMIHINYGWNGNSDGYYNISDDEQFNASGYDWYVDRQQYVVIGIEPDRRSSSGGGGGGCFIMALPAR